MGELIKVLKSQKIIALGDGKRSTEFSRFNMIT